MDEGLLWGGASLLEAEELLKSGALNDPGFKVAQAFIQASVELRARQEQEEDAQRTAQQELKHTQVLAKEQQKRADDQALANNQLRRVQNWLFAAIVIVFLLAVAAAGLGQKAQQQADIAATAEIRAQDAAKQTKLTQSKFWAEEVTSTITKQPQGSLLLAAEAVALSTQLQGEPIPRTVQALQSILAQTGGEPLLSNDNHVIADANLLTISPDQHWLAAGSRDGAIYLWDLTANKPLTAVTTLHPHTAAVTTMAFSSDGHWLATGSKDHTVQLTYMTATEFAASVTLTGHSDDVTTLAFKPTNILTDGSAWLATGSAGGTVQLFALDGQDSTTGLTAFKTLLEEASISKVAFSPDGRWLATITISDTLKLWKVDPNHPAMDSQVLSREKAGLIAFSPNGKWLVAASNKSPNVQLYAMANPDGPFLGGQLPGQGQGIYALAFDATERWLAVGSDDGSVQIWDLDAVMSQLQLPQLPEQPPVASPTGEQPLVLSYPMLTATIPLLLSGHNGAVSALAFAPASDYLATGGVDYSFRLWRMADLVAESGPVLYPWLKFYSSDGAMEAILWGEQKDLLDDQEKKVFTYTYNRDGSIRLWKPLAPPPTLKDLTTEELVALACARAGRDFSALEKALYFGDSQYVSTCSQINVQPR